MDKQHTLSLSHAHVCPNRVDMFGALGVDLVVGRREGYRIWDVDGRELIDVHINGGTFNLGHCNEEVVATLVEHAPRIDIGNHHFPSPFRAELGVALSETTRGRLPKVVFSTSGSEAIDVAIKSARRATGRRKIVSIQGGYHGRTGLSGAAGDPSAASFFLSDRPSEFASVPFNDLEAVEAALSMDDVAAVLVETIPATLGFPLPAEGYLLGVQASCERHGTLYIADEVQTGLGRTGPLWAFERFGAAPDIIVTGKGLSGGVYPIAATLLSEAAGRWLSEDGWAHVSTFGGSELGCAVALKVLEITRRPDTIEHASSLASRLDHALLALADAYPFLSEVRQCGLVFGLRFDDALGGMKMSKVLYDHGVWAMFAGFDRSVLQFKPGLLMERDDTTELLRRLEIALRAVNRG